MNTIIILVLVVSFAFLAGRFLNAKLSRFVSLSGVEYLLIGVLIGPLMPWPILTYERLDGLAPLVQLLTGLLGFLLGLEGREAFRKRDAALLGLGSSLLVAVTVAGALLPLFAIISGHIGVESDFFLTRRLLDNWGYVVRVAVPSFHLWAAVIVGAAAASCSSFAVSHVRKLFGSHGEVGDTLETVARSSQIGSVFFLGAGLAGARATEATGLELTITEWEVVAVALGVVCGLLFALFMGKESDESRIFLATTALVTFASGIGALAGVSPLFVNLFAGLTVSLTSPSSNILVGHLEKLFHPLFVLLMLFAGALFVPAPFAVWLAIPLFIVARLGARRIAINSMSDIVLAKPPSTRLLASGTWAPGSLSVAIAVSGSYRFPSLTPLLTTTVLCGAVICELFSHRALKRLLDDADELPLPGAEGDARKGAETT